MGSFIEQINTFLPESSNEVVFFGLTLEQVSSFALNILGAISILILGWIVSAWAARFVRRMVDRSTKLDRTLGLVFAALARWAILAFTIVAVLGQFGVETTSIVALLGAAGLAIGLALQGTLSNIAAGVMLLALRPFKVGDAVEIGGTSGIIDELGLFSTQMHTFDNVAIYMPNSRIWGAEVRNMSRNPTRRLDLVYGIGYGDDIGKATDIIKGILEADERVLAEPEYVIGVDSLGDSSVNLIVRPWVERTEYLNLKLDLNRTIKEAFDANGISIPFPQRDVHVVEKVG